MMIGLEKKKLIAVCFGILCKEIHFCVGEWQFLMFLVLFMPTQDCVNYFNDKFNV